MLSGIAFGAFGAGLRSAARALAHVSTTIALMIDGFDASERGGTVSLRPDGGPKLDYPLGERQFECFRTSMKAMVRLQLANGALQVNTLHTRGLAITDEAGVAQIDREPLGPNRCAVFTAHQMGGCRMGQDPARAVVDPHLRHHALQNLWVIDGSVFPTSLGVNPMESIYGLASWGSQHLVAALRSA